MPQKHLRKRPMGVTIDNRLWPDWRLVPIAQLDNRRAIAVR